MSGKHLTPNKQRRHMTCPGDILEADCIEVEW
jgi:hypothetical protein